jgi:hypothetical protein
MTKSTQKPSFWIPLPLELGSKSGFVQTPVGIGIWFILMTFQALVLRPPCLHDETDEITGDCCIMGQSTFNGIAPHITYSIEREASVRLLQKCQS